MPDDSVAARPADTAAYLDVRVDAYELRLKGEVIARLVGGSAALVRGTGALRDIDIETAIERSEDWLMPFSNLVSGRELRVRDETGRLRKVLGEQDTFTVADLEQVFTRVFDSVAHGRSIDRHGVADVVLVRELVHHGRLLSVWIEDEREAGAEPVLNFVFEA